MGEITAGRKLDAGEGEWTSLPVPFARRKQLLAVAVEMAETMQETATSSQEVWLLRKMLDSLIER